ncbi:MAG TPA: hypothetical protein VG816_09165 [Solirubrobacterales bacterium]|nr:hypothetical protein [Solirubrobacterales bacterium]
MGDKRLEKAIQSVPAMDEPGAWGTVDASVIAMAEPLDATEVATLDRRNFSVVRPRHEVAFQLLP